MSLVKSAVLWLRQSFAWSNSSQSWQERGILALFLLAAVGLGFLSVSAELWLSAILWVAYVVAITICSRQGWLQLFGPVLFYDMIRSARQNRFIAMRFAYAILLLTILWMIFGVSRRHMRNDHVEAAVLAETFFKTFMCVQLGLVVLLTPAYVAGSIAEEKDRKTLEFMLATDLSNHEIVLSKLLSRLANLTLFLMTGLPILSMLQFVGGVDTDLMLAGFAGTGLTMLGIASVSILFSTLFQRPRDAIGLTYLFLVAHGALATLGYVLKNSGVWFMTFTFGGPMPTLADVSDILNAGNPLSVLADIEFAIEGAGLAARLPELMAKYAYFHGVLSLICIVWSIVRLRAIALKQTVSGTTQKVSWWDRYRPPLGDLPMLWKELHIEGRMKSNWLVWGLAVILVLLTVGSGLYIIGAHIWDMLIHGEAWWEFTMQMNIWFRIAGTGVACLMLLMVGVRASTCITNERERDTFDALLTTPMSAETMLYSKLLGCLTSMRLGWIWFGSMIAVGLLSGALHPLAVPIVIVSWFIYAVAFAMVGIGYSMVCQSSMRSTVFTVLTTLFLGGGHWLLMGLCCYFPAAMSGGGGNGDGLMYIAKFELGMTPPFVLAFCSYSWDNLARDFVQHDHRDFGIQMFTFSLLGLFLWGMGCLFFWFGVLVPKFREITRREELIYR